MSLRAAPGPQLSTGRLRVDAARAIAKLREYQLVDRTAWILEAIRAAVAGAATKLTLRGDANDIWLAWDGPAWPIDELPKLFDELVSPEPTEERYHLRLLAAAVNSALGGLPAYVDIYSIDGGHAHRARYTPEVLAEPTGDLDESPLRRIAATPSPAPAGIAPETGMLIHLRRRATLGMLTYLFWEREPPEIATAVAACQDIAVPLTIGNRTLHRDRHDRDISRLPLGDDLDGFVAIVDPKRVQAPHHEPTLEIAERGVVLARYPFALPPPLGVAGMDLRGKVPLRVFVDAKRMPTNASRSQVRRDVPPISTAEQRVPGYANKLIDELADAAARPEADARTRDAAITLIAAVVGGLQWASVITSAQLGRLARLPLLRDATGVARPISYSWSGQVYSGRTPLSEELAPWLLGMLWLRPGDPAAAILAGVQIDAAETKRQIKLAKRMRSSHEKFFDKQPSAAALVQSFVPRIKVRLGARVPRSCVPEDRFAGLTGEVALSSDHGDGQLLVLYQGRPIERVTLRSPINVDAVIDSQQLTPGPAYRSVVRDDHYVKVEAAARAGIVCAAEAVAAARWLGEPLPEGFTAGTETDHEADARLVRSALGLVRDGGLPIFGPLRTAAAWPTLDDKWLAYDDLAKERVIGFTTGAVRCEIPAGRLILTAGSQTLARLLPNTRIVDYDRGQADDVRNRAARMATKLATTYRFALAIEDGNVRGAIAPAEKSTIRLHHTGCELDARASASNLIGCCVAVDCDTIVPNRQWTAAEDPGQALSRSYAAWETALIRAAARTLAGDRPPELFGPEVSGLDNTLGRMLCQAIAKSREPVLEAPVVARLRAAPLIHVLGERDLVSLDEVIRRFPKAIPVVGKTAAPVIGYAPVVGDDMLSQALATLTGIATIDGTADLELRRRTALRQTRIAIHRKQAELPLELPDSVEIDPMGVRLRGLVAVSAQPRLEIAIRVENRPFQVHSHSGELPLSAIIDLDPIHVDATFETLSEDLSGRLAECVRRCARPLLFSIAAGNPAALADPGSIRTLLIQWLAKGDRDRDPLLAAPAFPTVYGGRISLATALQVTKTIWISSWQSDWLGPSNGEAPSPLDAGVLRIPPESGELEFLIRTLHKGPVHDVSDQIIKLQGQRRMDRGLIPIPALPHIPVELKRKLSELGVKHKLGLGEIGLIAGAASSVMIHAGGQPRERQSVDVLPAIHIAIEAPELITIRGGSPLSFELGGDAIAQISRLRDATTAATPGSLALSSSVQDLATPLVLDVIAKQSADALPPHIRRSIRRAVLARRIDVPAPVFELADGSWVGVDVVVQQIAAYGSAWAVTEKTQRRPRDPDRRVFLLAPDEFGVARGNYTFVDATEDLVLDAKAIANQQRDPATTLDIATPEDLMGVADLPGDGKTAPRGQVGALLPSAIGRRGLYPHRAMHPFEVAVDPCGWPTIALIDDQRFVPDRTWTGVTETTGAWNQAVTAVQAASEDVIRQAIPKPPGALAFARTTEGIDVTQNTQLQIRGAAWILGAPLAATTGIEVFDTAGSRVHVPASPLGIGGRIYVMGTGWEPDNLLERIIGSLYDHLIKKLPQGTTNKDLILAHRANALALGYSVPFDLPPDLYPGFRPEPLTVAKLAALFRERSAVRVLPIAEIEAELHEPEVCGVVEDGSELSQVVIHHLKLRAQRGGPASKEQRKRARPTPATPYPFPSDPIKNQPSSYPSFPPQPPAATKLDRRPPHAIQNLVDHVRRRLLDLGVPSFETKIVDRESPLVELSRELRFAGSSPRLIALANAMQARSPSAETAAAALLAHVIAVMDAQSKAVNAENQHRVLAALLVGS